MIVLAEAVQVGVDVSMFRDMSACRCIYLSSDVIAVVEDRRAVRESSRWTAVRVDHSRANRRRSDPSSAGRDRTDEGHSAPRFLDSHHTSGAGYPRGLDLLGRPRREHAPRSSKGFGQGSRTVFRPLSRSTPDGVRAFRTSPREEPVAATLREWRVMSRRETRIDAGHGPGLPAKANAGRRALGVACIVAIAVRTALAVSASASSPPTCSASARRPRERAQARYSTAPPRTTSSSAAAARIRSTVAVGPIWSAPMRELTTSAVAAATIRSLPSAAPIHPRRWRRRLPGRRRWRRLVLRPEGQLSRRRLPRRRVGRRRDVRR